MRQPVRRRPPRKARAPWYRSVMTLAMRRASFVFAPVLCSVAPQRAAIEASGFGEEARTEETLHAPHDAQKRPVFPDSLGRAHQLHGGGHSANGCSRRAAVERG